jgi:dTDP-glucose pyrophosphorylase
MILEIDETTRLVDLQKNFSASFPFLKLVVFKEVQQMNSDMKNNELTDSNRLINALRTNKKEVILEIHYWQKTGTVEKLFRDKAGLYVQIRRKQGQHWIETSGTDDLTLEEQNDIGRKATQDLLHGFNRPFEFEKPV